MTIEKASWHARLFFWALEVWLAFKDASHDRWRYQERTNVCFYLRTMVVWMPLVLLNHLLVLAYALAIFIGLPITFFGVKGYLTTLAVIGGSIGLFFLLRAILRDMRDSTTVEEITEMVIKAPARAIVEKGASFAEVVGAWYKAQKSRICPLIEFRR